MNGVNGGYAYPDTDYDAADGDYYVYGFRVPLLVVSTYTIPGHISGAITSGPTYHENPPYIHDFGSILGYVEYSFSLSPYDGGTSCGIEGFFDSTCSYPFADYFALDGMYECSLPPGCGTGWGGYPLSDFFSQGITIPRTFTTITGGKYSSSCFVSSSAAAGCFPSNFPSDPDDE